MQYGSDPAVLPTRIVRDAERREVRIPWADGHESTYSWEYLRRRCPCATCRGEWDVPGSMTAETILLADQAFLRTMQHVGRYAVQLVWGDGHDTGIYAFRDLRAMCPCAACSGARS